MVAVANESVSQPIDLELIAQRIVKLSEVATLEHLESLINSQAQGVLELVQMVHDAANEGDGE